MYPGLFNSTYTPTVELPYINDPVAFIGPWFLAAVLCSLLQGIILIQTWNYVNTYQTDRALVQCFVSAGVLLSTLKACHMIYIGWNMLVTNFGDYLSASTSTTSIKLSALFSSIIGVLVQSFFVHRLFILSKNWLFLGLVIPPLLLGPTGALILVIIVLSPPAVLLRHLSLINTAAYLMVSAVVVCDVLITGFTIFYLVRARTGFATTDTLINRLIKTAMQSAAAPTICAIINLIFNSQASKSAWVNLFNSLMPFLYVSSMLYTLSSRASIANSTSRSGTSGHAYELRSKTRMTTTGQPQNMTRPEVFVTRQRQTHADQTQSDINLPLDETDSKDPYGDDRSSSTVHKIPTLAGSDYA